MCLSQRLAQLLDDFISLVLFSALRCNFLCDTLRVGLCCPPCSIDIGLHLSSERAMSSTVLSIHVSHETSQFLTIQSFLCG